MFGGATGKVGETMWIKRLSAGVETSGDPRLTFLEEIEEGLDSVACADHAESDSLDCRILPAKRAVAFQAGLWINGQQTIAKHELGFFQVERAESRWIRADQFVQESWLSVPVLPVWI